jgi:hypothetical protein
VKSICDASPIPFFYKEDIHAYDQISFMHGNNAREFSCVRSYSK